MTIPAAGLFPDLFDTDENLFAVHDALRLTLAEDYNPGDTSITVDGDAAIFLKFPDTGIITLTDQCSDIKNRAVSFYYTSKGVNTFDGLILLPDSTDVSKPKRATNVTQNVMAQHRNYLKDAIIAIEEFAGIKGTVDVRPLGDTLEGRINFLRKLVLTPRVWFKADKTVGIVPMTVTFTDLSFRLGTDGTSGDIIYTWDFGDNTTSNISSISTISVISTVPATASNILAQDLDGGTITKTYISPGVYDVTLTVSNNFGADSLKLHGLINARVPAPDNAVVNIVPRSNQVLTPGTPTGGPYITPPVIRSPINTLIDLTISSGENPNTPGVSYAGEKLDGNDNPLDPITLYTWSLGDDLPHGHSNNTRASFGVGGFFDLVLRCDTEFGSYRITYYSNTFDIVENINLWLWNYTGSFSPGVNSVRAYEYGLISETFKARTNTTLNVSIDSSFLASVPNSSKQIAEFKKNNGFAMRSTTSSGQSGFCDLYWATGRTSSDSESTEAIGLAEYNGFTDTYVLHDPIANRTWNWVNFSSLTKSYFLFGTQTESVAPNTSPTVQSFLSFDLIDLTSSTTNLTLSNYLGGANELSQNVAVYSASGTPTYGYYSVYRSCWKDSTGFFLRNDGVGPFFRIKSFYRTEGDLTDPVQYIRKLPDMPGPTKLQGQLVPLQSGVYFFNNSGSLSAYNDTTGVWSTGGPGINSAAFRSLQDSTISGYDDTENSLCASSNGDRLAYLSFDYSSNAFIKFDEAELTFSSLGNRPTGEQWMLRVF